MENYILYHGNCFDGFGAAWVAQKHFPGELVPCMYGEPVPDIKGAQILLLDFSFPREAMIKLHAENEFLKVLDHHKTAQANCEGLDFCEFDMTRSGAGMTWDYFNAPVPRPLLIDVVEDRDLWRFEVAKSKELHAYITSFPKDVDVWNGLETELEFNYHECVLQGSAILRYHDQKVQEMAAFATTQPIGGFEVPVVNAPYNFASDVCHLLLERNQFHPFAATYFYRADGTKQYSLRAHPDTKVDVSEIAKMYGGGGHKKAAGFEINPDGSTRMSRNIPTETKGPQ